MTSAGEPRPIKPGFLIVNTTGLMFSHTTLWRVLLAHGEQLLPVEEERLTSADEDTSMSRLPISSMA